MCGLLCCLVSLACVVSSSVAVCFVWHVWLVLALLWVFFLACVVYGVTGFTATSCSRCPTAATFQCANSQPFPCPANLAYYAYPDYDNGDCNTYYSCRYGSLTRRFCPDGRKFDSAKLQCLTNATFSCDTIRLAYAQAFGGGREGLSE